MYSDWTTQFFGGLAVEFWVNVAPAPTDQEIEFLRSIFGDDRELLDIACGAGRFTIPLAAAGYGLTGIDISEDFLDVARRRNESIDWTRGDIRELPWTARFDGALCFGNSFAYFPRGETMQFLRGLCAGIYDVKRSRLDTQYTFKKGTRVETKDAHTCVFTTADVIDMLEASEFAVEDVFSSLARDPFSLGSPRAIFVTRRRKFFDMM